MDGGTHVKRYLGRQLDEGQAMLGQQQLGAVLGDDATS